MESSPSRAAQRGATPLALLLIVVVVLLALVLTLNALSAYRTSTARQGWDEVLGSWDEVMQRYPATEANASALESERLAAGLGLMIAPRHTERWGTIPEAQRVAFERVRFALFHQFLKDQIERARRGPIDPPPTELSAYMAEYGEELTALRRHLIRGAVPVWESDLSAAEYAPLPNLLGHINLQKLLAAVALARLHAGDSDGALADIEAAWQLSKSLRDSPILISQLILLAGVRYQLGVLRQVPDVEEIWLDRLAEHDFRASFIDAMKYEGWVWLYFDGSNHEELPLWQRAMAPLSRPYTKLCLADVSEAWRERLVNLERVDAICDRDLAPYGAEMEITLPRWNKVGEMYVPNLVNAIDRMARLELDLELTRLVIEADTKRRANGGAWAEALTTELDCVACPDDRWSYSASGQRLEIALSRDVRWPGQKGPVLPTRFAVN